MVTRKSVAAKTATQSPARGATKPARAASVRPAPAKGVTKSDGKTTVAKAGGKTATATKAGSARSAAPQVSPKVARKDARKAAQRPAAKVPAHEIKIAHGGRLAGTKSVDTASSEATISAGGFLMAFPLLLLLTDAGLVPARVWSGVMFASGRVGVTATAANLAFIFCDHRDPAALEYP